MALVTLMALIALVTLEISRDSIGPTCQVYFVSTIFNGLQGISFICLSVHDAMPINIIIIGYNMVHGLIMLNLQMFYSRYFIKRLQFL